MSEAQTETQTPAEQPVEAQPVRINVDNMSAKDRLLVLQHVHTFFSNFDRVPGHLAHNWANSLDALAAVANSINKELVEAAQEKVKQKKSKSK